MSFKLSISVLSLCLLLGSASLSMAEQQDSNAVACPICPAGCVPVELVQEYAFDPEKYEDSCPPACADIRLVRSLSAEPGCLMAPLRLSKGFTEEKTVSLIPQSKRYSHTLNRIVTSRTALPLENNKFSATGYVIGLWELNGSPYKNWQIGLLTIVPAGFFAFVPHVHYSDEIANNNYLGAGIFGGYFSNIFGLLNTNVWITGGSLEYTRVYRNKHVLNVMMMAMGGGGDNNDNDGNGVETWPFAILLPSLGYQYRFSRDWVFNLDTSVPIIIDDHGEETAEDIEKMFTLNIFYGVRGHGGILFGDIGFYLPASKWFKDSAWRYLPLGIPYFSIGVEI